VPGATEGTVVLCEQLGSEQHVHVRMGKYTVIARVAATADFQLQQTVFVTFAVETLCLFDEETTSALRVIEHRHDAAHVG
jgi:ABC-type sugar transport system ATPase subunit